MSDTEDLRDIGPELFAEGPPICSYDVAGTAACPFSRPVAWGRARHSRVACRWYSVEPTPRGLRGICRRPMAGEGRAEHPDPWGTSDW